MKRARSLRRSLAARARRLMGRPRVAKLYQGPLVDAVRRRNEELDRGAKTPEEVVQAIAESFASCDLEAELGALLDKPAGTLQPTGFLQLGIHPVGKGQGNLWLFFAPAGVTYPPHAHHDMLSVQHVVRGNVSLRQYERVTRLDDTTLGIRPASDRVLTHGEAILMTEFLDNVHWFGAEGGPAVILNFHRSRVSPRTFDPRDSRPSQRYFVDPTGDVRPDGMIAAPHMKVEDARARFARRPIRDFPFQG